MTNGPQLEFKFMKEGKKKFSDETKINLSVLGAMIVTYPLIDYLVPKFCEFQYDLARNLTQVVSTCMDYFR
ncbi:MAG: hypothetical protein WCX73_03355 [Candidatus Pacearchaeota archaeon]|jgi:hypothetical protein